MNMHICDSSADANDNAKGSTYKTSNNGCRHYCICNDFICNIVKNKIISMILEILAEALLPISIVLGAWILSKTTTPPADISWEEINKKVEK